MESAGPPVNIDLMVRSLLRMGGTRKEVVSYIDASRRRRAAWATALGLLTASHCALASSRSRATAASVNVLEPRKPRAVSGCTFERRERSNGDRELVRQLTVTFLSRLLQDGLPLFLSSHLLSSWPWTYLAVRDRNGSAKPA